MPKKNYKGLYIRCSKRLLKGILTRCLKMTPKTFIPTEQYWQVQHSIL